MKKVAVLHAQVPFTKGGAELLVEGLVEAINEMLPGVEAELIQIPFKWYPESQILSDMMAWRMLDLTEAAGNKIDLVIGTKFPSYALSHPNKVIWLVHQHRAFYDLEGTSSDKVLVSEDELYIRNKVRESDAKFISEAKGVYTIARTVSDRLEKFNGITSQPISPPSKIAKKIYPGENKDYILCVARIDKLKRQELLIEAAALVPEVKVIIVGKGDRIYTEYLCNLINKLNIGDRVDFKGYVGDDELLDLLANCKGVFYAPVDEDYGYATIEGFLAKKNVITTTCSGEVQKFVEETGSGFVSSTSPVEIAKSFQQLYQMSDEELKVKVQPGYELAKKVTWEDVLKELVEPYL